MKWVFTSCHLSKITHLFKHIPPALTLVFLFVKPLLLLLESIWLSEDCCIIFRISGSVIFRDIHIVIIATLCALRFPFRSAATIIIWNNPIFLINFLVAVCTWTSCSLGFFLLSHRIYCCTFTYSLFRMIIINITWLPV